jgi:hypothetical protein
MTIDYTESGTVKFSMDEMIQECLGAFGENLESMAAKPQAANHLFAVNIMRIVTSFQRNVG